MSRTATGLQQSRMAPVGGARCVSVAASARTMAARRPLARLAEQSGTCRDGGRMRSSRRAQLPQDIRHVNARGLRTHKQRSTDLGVGPALRYKPQYRELTLGQVVTIRRGA